MYIPFSGTDKVILSQKEKLYKNKISYLFIFPQVIRIKKKYVLVHMWEVIGDGRSFDEGLFPLSLSILDNYESRFFLHFSMAQE